MSIFGVSLYIYLSWNYCNLTEQETSESSVMQSFILPLRLLAFFEAVLLPLHVRYRIDFYFNVQTQNFI